MEGKMGTKDSWNDTKEWEKRETVLKKYKDEEIR
jgi:hypothetical protein